MSALFAYAGKTPCRDIIIDGLERLYSERFELSGIVIKEEARFEQFKIRGNSRLLGENSKELSSEGCIGIAQSSRAHRCKPSGITAPPAANEYFALALDGVVENFDALKNWCKSPLPSATDEELLLAVITKLREFSPLEIISSLSNSVKGSPGYVFMSFEDEALYAKSGSSPLAVGLCEDGYCVSSELSAILPFAKKYFLLKDGEYARITNEKAAVYDSGNRKIKKQSYSISVIEPRLDGYMLSESLAVLPFAIKDTVNRFLREDALIFDSLKLSRRTVLKTDRIILTGTDESYRACELAAYYLEALTDIPATAIESGELISSGTVFTRETLVIAVSSSGEDKDTLACVRRAKSFNSLTVGVCSSLFSMLELECSKMLKPCPKRTGDALYSYLSSSLALLLFALWLGNRNDVISDRYYSVALKLAELLPGKISSAVKHTPVIYSCAEAILSAEYVFTAGTGADYELADEAAAMIRRSVCLPASRFCCAGLSCENEAILKNSVIAAFITNKEFLDKTLCFLRRCRCLGAKVIIFTTSYVESEINGFDLVVPVTDSLPVFDSLSVLASVEATLDSAKNILAKENEQQAG